MLANVKSISNNNNVIYHRNIANVGDLSFDHNKVFIEYCLLGDFYVTEP